MAYIIGLCTDKEIKELKKRGWEVEDIPKECKKYFRNDSVHSKEGLKYQMVFVDSDMIDVMSGPDWEK